MPPLNILTRETVNPLHPYEWTVFYKDGGSLKQFDFDGYHQSLDIDLARARTLVILNHPSSPIILDSPYPGRPVDEVILKAQVSLEESFEIGTQKKVFRRYARFFFGFRFGAEKFLLEIDEHGRLFKTNQD